MAQICVHTIAATVCMCVIYKPYASQIGAENVKWENAHQKTKADGSSDNDVSSSIGRRIAATSMPPDWMARMKRNHVTIQWTRKFDFFFFQLVRPKIICIICSTYSNNLYMLRCINVLHRAHKEGASATMPALFDNWNPYNFRANGSHKAVHDCVCVCV